MANNIPAVYKGDQVLFNAMESIRESNPDAFPILEKAIYKDIAVLNDNDVFMLRSPDGAIRAFKRKLVLSAENGGLVQPVPGGSFVVSAQGYEKWAEAVSASVLFMKQVLVHGQWENNPYAEIDENTGRIIRVHARAVAFMYNSVGVPVVVDWTTVLDAPTYRMIDLIAKAERFPQAFRLLPRDLGQKMFRSETKEDTETPEGPPPTWGSYPFDQTMDLWVNSSHPEALSWYRTILNREKKTIDFAQTFARRNALKHLSGIQKVPGQEVIKEKPYKDKRSGEDKVYRHIHIDPIAQWVFPVICWRPEAGSVIKWDAAQYEFLKARVQKMVSGSAHETIELQAGSEAVIEPEVESEMDIDQEPVDEEKMDELPEGLGVSVTDEIKTVDKMAGGAPKDPGMLETKEYKNLKATIDNFPEESKQVFEKNNIPFNPDYIPESINQAKAMFKAIERLVTGGEDA